MNISDIPSTVVAVFLIASPIAAAEIAPAGAEKQPGGKGPSGNPSRITIPKAGGQVEGFRQIMEWPKRDWNGHMWTGIVHTVYIPSLGLGWAGTWAEQHLAVIEDRIVSLYYQDERNNVSVRMAVSTNNYAVGLTNISAVMAAEFSNYTNNSRRYGSGPQYFIELERLLGSATLRDHEETNIWGGQLVLSTITRPSKCRALIVEGANVVAVLEFGTNMLARVAFNKELKPVWATTNGVSIGPIPTNCVFHSEVVTNKPTLKVVY